MLLVVSLILGVWIILYTSIIDVSEEYYEKWRIIKFYERDNVSIEDTSQEMREEELREVFRQEADYVEEDLFDGEVYINITDIENCNEYRNEEYGFQLNFPPRPEGNDCKVIKKISFSEIWSVFIDFQFMLSADPEKWNGLWSNPILLSNTKLFDTDPESEYHDKWVIPLYWRYSSFILTIMDENWYNDPLWDHLIYTREYMKEHIISQNNKYYFKVMIDPECSYYKFGYGISDGEKWYNYIKDHINVFDI